MSKNKVEKPESKVNIFRRLLREGKSIAVAMTESGVAKATAHTQAYKVRKETGGVKARTPKVKVVKAPKVRNEDGEEEINTEE